MSHLAPNHWLQLWFSRVGEASLEAESSVLECLSETERERLRRMGRQSKRREYQLSRKLMRHALSQKFQRAEAEWQFSEQREAPPQVSDLPVDTFLSLSHSKGYVCFAIASSPVGVDIEIVNPDRGFLDNARFFMDEGELELLAGQGARRADYFYRSWCAKEACYKTLPAPEQAKMTMSRLNYADMRDGRDGRRLIEGDGGEFRFAAVIANGPLQVEQHSYLEPLAVTLDH